MAARKILLYGDVDLNILDGSAIWLCSMAEALAGTDSELHVLLKADERTDRLSAVLRDLEGVIVHSARKPRLSPQMARRRIEKLDTSYHYDAIIARGIEVCTKLSGSARLSGRLWLYVTELGAASVQTGLPQEVAEKMRHLAPSARRLFAQTEQAREVLERQVPDTVGKTLLLPPMVPDDVTADPADYEDAAGPVQGSRPLRLVYSGKFARQWKTLEMAELPEELGASGITAELTLIGDKVQKDAEHPEWADAMRRALQSTSAHCTGGLPRREALAEVARHDIGLSWRSRELDDSLEISTKVLEYMALGVPPLLNRTAAHADLLGDDYPLFLEGDATEDVVAALRRAHHRLPGLGERIREKVAPFRISSAAQRLERQLSEAAAESSDAGPESVAPKPGGKPAAKVGRVAGRQTAKGGRVAGKTEQQKRRRSFWSRLKRW